MTLVNNRSNILLNTGTKETTFSSIRFEDKADAYPHPSYMYEDERDEAPEAQWEEGQLQKARTKLFENGSDFQPTTRDQIVGIDNVLVEIDQLIHWLQNSKKYQKYKARLEPGVLFEGDPGTGKTLVSRYIATASDALFVNIRDFAHNGSLYRDSDIADLFKRARETYEKTERPIVLFWDEFENGAAERAQATPEQAATVSQITAELDGVHGKNEGILLIGCTNYIYGIDAALRRPGRMGLQIEFNAPDRTGKKLLLKYYLGHYRTEGEIDVETLSYFFNSDDTAAAIEEACMEAWRLAVYEKFVTESTKPPKLTQQNLIDVFLKRLVGPPTAFINLPMEDRARVAVHEVGHAIMSLVFDIPLRLITVQPGKKSLGRTITAEVREYIGTFDEIISDMRIGVGSICAERIAELPAGIGSGGDISQVNKMATRLVDELHGGRSTGLFYPKAVGSVRFDPQGGASPSIATASVDASDRDVQYLLEKVESDGVTVMSKIGKDAIWKMADAVNETVTLTGVQFKDLFVQVTGEDPKAFRPDPWS